MFDPYGTGRAPRGMRKLQRQGRLMLASAADADAAIAAYAAASGTRDRIWRMNEQNNSEQWAWARCYVDIADRDPLKLYASRGWYTIDVSCNLEIQSPVWYGMPHGGPGVLWGSAVWGDTPRRFWGEVASTPTTLTALSGTPQTVGVLNNGTAPATNPIITVVAGSSAITSLHITGGGTDITWTGTLAATKSLVIDAGGVRITNDGTEVYGLTINSGHTLGSWFSIAAGGTTTYSITGAGGGTGSTINIFSRDTFF